MMDKKMVSEKIRKIMKEGIGGHKVNKDQSIAVALNMARKRKK
mgnify:CR=1 FL=1